MSNAYNIFQASALHDAYEQRLIGRFRGLAAATVTTSIASHRKQSKHNAAADPSYTGGNTSYGGSSLSRSPRFAGYADSSNTAKDDINVRDRLGRTVLHLIASNTNEDEASDYLEAVLAASPNVNLQDRESGWTALHRALYYGNLLSARRLLQHPDTDIHIRDSEGMTAFDLLNSTILGTNPGDVLDATLPVSEEDTLRRELITWGANRNFVLGLQGDNDRTFPERVPLERTASSSRPANGKQPAATESRAEESFQPVNVRKIAMEKLHSALLTDDARNNFRLCGFGSTTGRLGHNSQHPQFAFEPLRDFSHARVTDFALGQDHTIICTDKGDVWTFGLNSLSVLGYIVESTGTKNSSVEEPVQPVPKRIVGALKKEFVIGVAASRYHSCCFTSDALFTWGKNNGQLGYSTSTTPIQIAPRKVTAVTQPIKQICATEVATCCLLEGGEVFVLHRDTYYRITFPVSRFPSAMQVYRPPNIAARPSVLKVAGSGSTFIALTDLGDVFSWRLENPVTEAASATSFTTRDVKPTRIWEDRKSYTAAKDCCIADDTIVVCTRSGHVYVRSRRKELNSVRGFELKSSQGSSAPLSNSNKKGQYKFTRISNLQRVVNVAVSPSGGFAAIRSDAPLLRIPPAGDTLSKCLLDLLPHYRRLNQHLASDTRTPLLERDQQTGMVNEEDFDDDSIESDKIALDRMCCILALWSPSWSNPDAGSDLLLVAGSSGAKLPVHAVILSARSVAIKQVLAGQSVKGLKLSRSGNATLHIQNCSHLSALLLVHYLYSDEMPAIYDPRLFQRLQAGFPKLKIRIAELKAELQSLAILLQLPALIEGLRAYGKTSVEPTLSPAIWTLREDTFVADVILETASEDIVCHSTVLRARCPFFQAMFNDPDWYATRLEASDGASGRNLRVDLKHLRTDIVQLVLQYVYTDGKADLFANLDFDRIDDKIDYISLVLAAANELLLDGLKAVCSDILRSLVALPTVCAILCEAIFYEATALQDCCMQYICCNFETMLEQQLLDILPRDAVAKLAIYCRQRQLDRLARTRRSIPILSRLVQDNADLVKDWQLDLPRVTGAYKKFQKQLAASAKSPKLSPVLLPLSLRSSSAHGLSVSPQTLLSRSPPSRQFDQAPPSPTLSTPGPSPLVTATHADDDMLPDMDDLSLSASDAIVAEGMMRSREDSVSSPLSQSKRMWLPAAVGASPQSLRSIMEQATDVNRPRRTFEAHPVGPVQSSLNTEKAAVFTKISQKDRKRQQSQQGTATSQSSATSEAVKVSPWRPSVPPVAWQPPTTPNRPPQTSLAEIQTSQAVASGGRIAMRSAAPTSAGTPLVASGVTQSGADGRPSTPAVVGRVAPSPSSAVGAPVITPVRMIASSKPSFTDSSAPRGTHQWANYSSTVSSTVEADSLDFSDQSFSSIQNLQATERAHLKSQRGPQSLAEIQEEEAERRREAEFLAWFEEESKRAQAASEPAGLSTTGRGGPHKSSTGRGRGGGNSGNRASGSGGAEARGQGRTRGRRGNTARGSTGSNHPHGVSAQPISTRQST